MNNEITELQKKLRAIEKFPDQNPNPVIKMSFDGTLLYANHASNSLLHVWQVDIGDKLDPRLLSHALSQSHKLEPLEIEISDRWFSFYIVPVPSMDFINMYGNEITASKQNKRILSALNFASTPLLISTQKGDIRFSNRAAKSLFQKIYPEENPRTIYSLHHILPPIPPLKTIVFPYEMECSIGKHTISISIDCVEHQEDEYCIEIIDLSDLRRSQKEIQQLITNIASGDFTERIESNMYEGFLHQIANSINQMLDVLNKALHSITSIGIDLTHHIPFIRDSSLTLSSVSVQQSTASSEVVQSLEQISQVLDHNVNNSQRALGTTDAAVKTGELGLQNMLESLMMMKKLKQEMEEVKKSMRQINDITFQTELLSLNAAVEAARAKEEGRGFSVVAQEVRRLAQNCAQTASKTEEVTERVSILVQKGHSSMEQTATYFQLLLDGVLSIKNEAEEIAWNSKEHSSMVIDLHKTILEIEKGAETVKKQSGSLQDSVHNLSKQSDELESILKEFQLLTQKDTEPILKSIELNPLMAQSILLWLQNNKHRISPEESQ